MTSEMQLWKRLREGDRIAFEEIFRRYYQDLYRFAVNFCGSSQLAEDQIQELFLKIWQRRESLADDVQAIRPYLWISLRRELIDEKRRVTRILRSEERRVGKGCRDRESVRR